MKKNKMSEETPLSEQRMFDKHGTVVYFEQDVKEAVEKLKEELCKEMKERNTLNISSLDRIPQPFIWDTIDNIFGRFE